MKLNIAAIVPLGLLGALAFALQGGQIHIKGPQGEFDIENIDKLSTDNLMGVGKLSLTGHPFHVYWRDAGVEMSAASLLGETALDGKTQEPFLKTGSLTGNATLTMDSRTAEAYAAKAAGANAPTPSPFWMRFGVTSDVIDYGGNYNIGTLNVPANFTGTWARHASELVDEGNKHYVRLFDESLDVHGVSGTLEFFTHSVDPSPFRKGTVMGPVTFKFTRTSTLEGKDEPPITVNGQAGRMDLDFISATKTITLSDKVHLDGVGFAYSVAKEGLKLQRFSGSTDATKVVITFGANGNVQRIDMDGAPTISNLKPLKPGGGGL